MRARPSSAVAPLLAPTDALGPLAWRDGQYPARVSVDSSQHFVGSVGEVLVVDEVRALRWDGDQLVARVVDRGVVTDVTWPDGAPIWSMEPDPPVAASPYAGSLAWAASPSARLGEVARSFVAVAAEATDPLGYRRLGVDLGLGARSWAWIEAERCRGARIGLQAGHRVTDAASADTDVVVTAGSTGAMWVSGGLGATVPWRFDASTSRTGAAVGSTWAAAGYAASVVRVSALAGASLASSDLAPWTRGAAAIEQKFGAFDADLALDGWWAAPDAPAAILPLAGPAPDARAGAVSMRTIVRSSVLPDLVALPGPGGAGVARVGWSAVRGSVAPSASVGLEALVGPAPILAPTATVGVSGRFGEISVDAAFVAPIDGTAAWGQPVVWAAWSAAGARPTVQP